MLAFNSVYADIRRLEAKLKECTEKNDAHIHALAVLENDWLDSPVAPPKPSRIHLRGGASIRQVLRGGVSVRFKTS